MPSVKNWCPVLVVGNRRAGYGEALSVLAAFRQAMNPSQVTDIADCAPEAALGWCRVLAGHLTCRVVSAGGDGTANTVLNTIHKMNLERDPYVAVLPLGTGNDLSNVLGFTYDYSKRFDVKEYLQ